MPRPQRPLDPHLTPAHGFAHELRLLRERAGNPKFLAMARATGRSRTSLAEAAGGDHLPTWETVEAFVRACGGDPREWLPRWEKARDEVRAPAGPPHRAPLIQQAAEASAPASAVSEKRRHPRRAILVGAAGLLLASAVVAYVGHQRRPIEHAATKTGPIAIVVQNKVALGSDTLAEDTTPAYLSTTPRPRCAHQGCKIAGTEMWSGAVLAVTCFVHGQQMHNYDASDPRHEQNPHSARSTIWYRGVLPDGRTGYIAEIYVEPRFRGGSGLPKCQ